MTERPIVKLLAPLAISLVLATAAPAGEPKDEFVILELYTSQGCSSCPPADDFLSELANAESKDLPYLSGLSAEVIPLGFHVDYWDYLGWVDEMADSSFTQRQRDYARSHQKTMIYTPQMIVQGEVFAVGSDRAAILAAIRSQVSAKSFDMVVSVAAGNDNRTLELRIDPDTPAPISQSGRLDVTYVRYRVEPEVVHVRSGENRNRNISYANVVTDLRHLGKWNQNGAFRGSIQLNSRRDGRERELIVLQQTGFGRIVGASYLE